MVSARYAFRDDTDTRLYRERYAVLKVTLIRKADQGPRVYVHKSGSSVRAT